MLALTPTAVQAIEGLTSQPGIPDSAGLKLSGQETPEGTQVELTLAESPEESDQVLETENAKVFVAAPLAPMLDDKVLDAAVQDEKIAFRLLEQPSADGS